MTRTNWPRVIHEEGIPVEDRDAATRTPAPESVVVSYLGEAQFFIAEAMSLVQQQGLSELEAQGKLMSLLATAKSWVERAGREGLTSRYSAVSSKPKIPRP